MCFLGNLPKKQATPLLAVFGTLALPITFLSVFFTLFDSKCHVAVSGLLVSPPQEPKKTKRQRIIQCTLEWIVKSLSGIPCMSQLKCQTASEPLRGQHQLINYKSSSGWLASVLEPYHIVLNIICILHGLHLLVGHATVFSLLSSRFDLFICTCCGCVVFRHHFYSPDNSASSAMFSIKLDHLFPVLAFCCNLFTCYCFSARCHLFD